MITREDLHKLAEEIYDALDCEKDTIDESDKLVVGVDKETEELSCAIYAEKQVSVEIVAKADFQEGFKVYDAQDYLNQNGEVDNDKISDLVSLWAEPY